MVKNTLRTRSLLLVYLSRVGLMNNFSILLQDVDPTYALPVDLVEALGLARQVMPELVTTGDQN